MNYMFPDDQIDNVPEVVKDTWQGFIEDRLNAIPRGQFFPGNVIHTGDPFRANREHMWEIESIDTELDLCYLKHNGHIDTWRGLI